MKTGRVGKYQVDLGWERMMQVCNVYGQAGGSKQDKAVAEAILAAIREERNRGQHLPILITGDSTQTPESCKTHRAGGGRRLD